MVVFPAASKPTIRIRISFFPNRLLNSFSKIFPIENAFCDLNEKKNTSQLKDIGTIFTKHKPFSYKKWRLMKSEQLTRVWPMRSSVLFSKGNSTRPLGTVPQNAFPLQHPRGVPMASLAEGLSQLKPQRPIPPQAWGHSATRAYKAFSFTPCKTKKNEKQVKCHCLREI